MPPAYYKLQPATEDTWQVVAKAGALQHAVESGWVDFKTKPVPPPEQETSACQNKPEEPDWQTAGEWNRTNGGPFYDGKSIDVAPSGNFSWTPVTGATHYKLRRYNAQGQLLPGSPTTINGTGTTLTHTAGLLYSVQIQACNSCGCSPMHWDTGLMYVAY